MKIIHIETKSRIKKIKFKTKELPKKIGVVATVQHVDAIPKVIEFLKSKNITGLDCGQVLGCSQKKAAKHKKEVDAFLYVGSGEFHPIGLAMNTDKPVYILHPDMQLSKVNQQEITRIEKRKRGMLTRFLSSRVIGVLISVKPGQNCVQGGLDKVREVEKQYPDKEFYYFMNETLDFNELDNFGFIESWVNTMCPRLMQDIKVLNLEDIDRVWLTK